MSKLKVAAVGTGYFSQFHYDAWSRLPVELAACCSLEEDQAKALPEAAGVYRADVLSGALFAASMRQQGNNPSSWTERICRLFLGMTAYQASDWIDAEQDAVLAELPRDDADRGGRCYLAVRQRMNKALAEERHYLET